MHDNVNEMEFFSSVPKKTNSKNNNSAMIKRILILAGVLIRHIKYVIN